MLPGYEYFLVTSFLHLLLERSAEIVLRSCFPGKPAAAHSFETGATTRECELEV